VSAGAHPPRGTLPVSVAPIAPPLPELALIIPHAQPAQWPPVAPGRWAAAVRTQWEPGCRIAMLGAPDDLGVRLNSGRPGAAGGPAAVRSALARYGTSFDLSARDDLPTDVFDAGDVAPAPGDTPEALVHTHTRVQEACAALHALGCLVIVIGGGHDLSLPAGRALAQHTGRAIAGLNIDPHLDVRDTPGSGMAFRSLIEGGSLDAPRFSTLGAGRFASSREHVEWLRSRGAHITLLDDLRGSPSGMLARAIDRWGDRPGFVSFDLDSLDASVAPGVSALNPDGLSVREAASMLHAAGAAPRVRQLHLMELNPAFDEQGRTARVAAHLVLQFLAGFSRRPA